MTRSSWSIKWRKSGQNC